MECDLYFTCMPWKPHWGNIAVCGLSVSCE
uniref:Uncharacterized protein n=1 Tax=Anguilla anguilla TaxID=7936 RepID=A0A0E9RYN4_ANGAN